MECVGCAGCIRPTPEAKGPWPVRTGRADPDRPTGPRSGSCRVGQEWGGRPRLRPTSHPDPAPPSPASRNIWPSLPCGRPQRGPRWRHGGARAVVRGAVDAGRRGAHRGAVERRVADGSVAGTLSWEIGLERETITWRSGRASAPFSSSIRSRRPNLQSRTTNSDAEIHPQSQRWTAVRKGLDQSRDRSPAASMPAPSSCAVPSTRALGTNQFLHLSMLDRITHMRDRLRVVVPPKEDTHDRLPCNRKRDR